MNDYFELKIKINPEIAEIISDICFEHLNCEGVIFAEEEYKDDLVLVSTTQDTLKVYLSSLENIDKTLYEQKNLLLSRGFSESDLGSWDFEISRVKDEDWSKKWKENWDVTHVSDRIAVVPSWIGYTPKSDEVIITLDPGTAFGTGTHATTQLCMRATEKYMQQGAKMADIGTGSGILAICGAKLGAQYAYGCDNDALVIKIAQENAILNNVSQNCFFECKTADVYVKDLITLNSFRGKVVNYPCASKAPEYQKFDFITANILHNVLANIMSDLKTLMNDNAKLVLSGILDEKKQVVLEALKEQDLHLIEELHQGIWVALIAEKTKIINLRKRGNKMGETAIIIPARYDSTRLKGKPLIKVKNKTIIQWVWEKAVMTTLSDRVIIATDNEQIFEEAESFGAEVEMTLDTHTSGSDRIAEVVERHPEISYVVNLQGDEPLITPESIDKIIKGVKNDGADISTLIRVLKDKKDIESPNCVKCVTDNNGFALYFSRSKIPYERNKEIVSIFGHLGIYGYTRESLLKMTQLPQSTLEIAEGLEQLRALQAGMKIKTFVVDFIPVGIDTVDDLKQFEEIISQSSDN